MIYSKKVDIMIYSRKVVAIVWDCFLNSQFSLN